ncbi:MAG: molecular chaperone DjiA [Bacteroidia bacterium]|nr:molecular chaperone DjiA [Bacteroidia bacterium]
MKFAKWLGGSIGWAFGGPLGAVLGFVLGSAVDNLSGTGNATARGTTGEGDFNVSLLVLSAAVMKADGKLMRSELDYIRSFFRQNFGEIKTNEMMSVLKRLMEQEIRVEDVCMQIRAHMPQAGRLQLLHFLYGVSRADGEVHPKEVEMINLISGFLGVNEADADSIRATYYQDLKHDYLTLEIPETASDEELKKAYRRMAVKFHPDKVEGMGEDVKRGAKEKFQRLQEAYDRIRKSRNIS